MYRDFAGIYDELMHDVDYKKWFDYIENIYVKEGITPAKVLEMACGTGSLTRYLAEAKYDVTCFDLSLEMLTVAESKLREYRNVKILNQDMIDFNLGGQYDSIISICDSINYILEDEDLDKVFENVYKHLSDDGIFIFDINSSYYLSEIISNNNFVEDRGEVFYSWESYYDEEEKINQFYINFFVKEEDGSYNRFIEEHYERAYEVDEIIEKLNKAGFKDIKYYQAFSYDEIDSKTERINFIVKK